MKKTLALLLPLIISLVLLLMLVSCENEKDVNKDTDTNIENNESTTNKDVDKDSSSDAEDNKSENSVSNTDAALDYELSDDGTYYIISGIGTVSDQNLVIPEAHRELPVKEIDARAFDSCTQLNSVLIPESIETIGVGAFNNCISIQNIYYNARNLHDLNKENYVFSNVGQNTSGFTLTIGNNVSSIPNYLFYKTNLTKLDFATETTCKKIGNYAFCETKLQSIKIPESMVALGEYAFANCKNVNSIIFNALSMNDLKYNTLPFCNTGTYGASLLIGKCVKKIPDYLFAQSTYSLRIKDSEKVSGIVSLTFEDNSICETIGKGAFMCCLNLKYIYIPYKMSEIKTNAFDSCNCIVDVVNDSLISVNIINNVVGNYRISSRTSKEPSKLFETNDGFVFWDNGTDYYLMEYKGSESNIDLPNDFLGESYKIYPSAFRNKNLTSVSIFGEVTEIGYFSFIDNVELTVIMGKSINYINYNAIAYDATVFYYGTESEWNEIKWEKYDMNALLVKPTCYFYSELSPVNKDNSWRWVDGTPTLW